jgi:CubicO group peptidase (beta-lactamase class C family)
LALPVSRAGALLFSRGYGLAELTTRRAVEPDTPFRIASLTKIFVGALFVLLARDKLVELDAPASRWLPDLPRSAEFTLRMLLRHTAGLGEYTDKPLAAIEQDARVEYDADALVAHLARTQPLYAHEPGAAWAYSNTGYTLLGVVAERATKTPIRRLLKQRVLEPAGLKQTAWDDAEARPANRAEGYGPGGNGWVKAPAVTASFIGASGALRSTAPDLCRWYDALFGGALLNALELAQMLAPATLRNGKLPARGGSEVRYGFGLRTGTASGRSVAWHTGTTAG